MIINDIKERLANGFKPFAIHLSDGRRFVVPQRDFIALTTNKIALFDEKGTSHIISTLHIVSIDDAVDRARKSGRRKGA